MPCSNIRVQVANLNPQHSHSEEPEATKNLGVSHAQRFFTSFRMTEWR